MSNICLSECLKIAPMKWQEDINRNAPGVVMSLKMGYVKRIKKNEEET